MRSPNRVMHPPPPRLRTKVLFSSNTSRQQQQQQQLPPKWPAVASVMVVPVMFLAWGTSDSIFGNRQIGKNEALRQEFLSSNNTYNNEQQQQQEQSSVICFCVVRRTSGFTHCLSGVQIGDVVEVLEEGVGPDNLYNLCRLPADPNQELSRDIYGWFPTRFLQKLDDYDKMVQEQLQNLEKK